MVDVGPGSLGQPPRDWATPLWTPDVSARHAASAGHVPPAVVSQPAVPGQPGQLDAPGSWIGQERPDFVAPRRAVAPSLRAPIPAIRARPTQPRPRLTLGQGVAGLVGAAVVVLSIVLVSAVAPFAPQPRAVAPASQASHVPAVPEPRARPIPTPTPTPTPTSTPTPMRAPIIGEKLYPLTLSGTCSKPAKDTTWAGVQKSIQIEAACLDAMWQPVVEAAGATWRKPVLLFYSDPIRRSPCGPSPDKDKAPAHYCAGNQTIYISDAVTDPVVRYRMLGFEVIAHEYTHHVQELTGILTAASAQGRGDLTTRRIELQAHCMAYVAMQAMDGLAVTAREWDQLRSSWNYSGDPAGHGSAEAQLYWGSRALKATSLAACDTFSVSEDLVT